MDRMSVTQGRRAHPDVPETVDYEFILDELMEKYDHDPR